MKKSIYSDDYVIFLEFLRDARQRAGLTQTQLAIALKETQSHISKIERGERRLDILELRKYCTALGVEFPAFVGELEAILGARRK